MFTRGYVYLEKHIDISQDFFYHPRHSPTIGLSFSHGQITSFQMHRHHMDIISYLSYSTDIMEYDINYLSLSIIIHTYHTYHTSFNAQICSMWIRPTAIRGILIHLAKLQILCEPEKRFQSYGITPIFIQSLWMTMTSYHNNHSDLGIPHDLRNPHISKQL